MTRLLITGSRSWTDEKAIEVALHAAYLTGSRLLVSGACPTGADAICERLWARQGLEVERHPAQWRPYGIYNPQAGLVRNSKMVNLGADKCLAFIHNGSRGATHCADVAEAAGIPTERIEV